MNLIDSFDFRKYPKAIITRNEQTRDKWDLEENVNFVNGLMNGRLYKIRKTPFGNDDKTLRYLNLLEEYIYTLKEEMIMEKSLCETKNCRDEVILFIITPCSVQEIPDNKIYEGVNKPKNIVSFSGDGLQFAKDNGYRSGQRHIMLSLRTKFGKLRSWAKVRRLFHHELAHTMCNHCTYREAGNHEGDFTKCENFIKLLSKRSKRIQDIEKKIQKELF